MVSPFPFQHVHARMHRCTHTRERGRTHDAPGHAKVRWVADTGCALTVQRRHTVQCFASSVTSARLLTRAMMNELKRERTYEQRVPLRFDSLRACIHALRAPPHARREPRPAMHRSLCEYERL
jgi:hypothetical protein